MVRFLIIDLPQVIVDLSQISYTYQQTKALLSLSYSETRGSMLRIAEHLPVEHTTICFQGNEQVHCGICS